MKNTNINTIDTFEVENKNIVFNNTISNLINYNKCILRGYKLLKKSEKYKQFELYEKLTYKKELEILHKDFYEIIHNNKIDYRLFNIVDGLEITLKIIKLENDLINLY